MASVRAIVSGGAALGGETAQLLRENFPSWVLYPAYGSTETAACIAHNSAHDEFFGSAGSLLPEVEVKLLNQHGVEIPAYGKPGALVAKSLSIALGYLANDESPIEYYPILQS